MGKKSSKSSTGPSKFAQPYIKSGADALSSVFQQQQPRLEGLTGNFDTALPGIVDQTTNDQGLAAASGYNQDVLGGKYLGQGNPYLEKMIGQTSNDVQNRVNGSIGARGRTGGDAHSQILGRELANSENSLRFNDYNTERSRMDSAVSGAGGLSSAGNQDIATLLAALQGGAELPYTGVNNYASGISGLLGSSQTQTSKPSTGSSIMQGLGTAASLASIFSDRRLKRDIERVGEAADGLGIYRYRYVWSDDFETGVMADEVAELRPWAIGPTTAGYAKVNYEAL